MCKQYIHTYYNRAFVSDAPVTYSAVCEYFLTKDNLCMVQYDWLGIGANRLDQMELN